MKVFMIGGTGLLGSQAAVELISRGHEVSSIALLPLPEGAILPPEMKIDFGNYLKMSDDEMRKHLEGCDGLFLRQVSMKELKVQLRSTKCTGSTISIL